MGAPGGTSLSPTVRRRSLQGGLALLAILAIALACESSWKPPEPTGHRRTGSVPEAGAHIGAEACSDCHASFAGHFLASDDHGDCESCHGPGQLHAHTALARDIAQPGNDRCESCHQIGHRTLMGWTSSRHAASGVLCSDCHATHDRELLLVRPVGTLEASMLPSAGTITRMCSSCHAEVVARFDLPSHHPMREGMLECTDCHEAHGETSISLGPDTGMCTSCHQEVAGPWVYEHAPVSEDCGHCHAPHGASDDFLLEIPQPASCISCHTIPISGAIHDPWAYTTRCTDCHNAVHGSYTDPILRR